MISPVSIKTKSVKPLVPVFARQIESYAKAKPFTMPNNGNGGAGVSRMRMAQRTSAMPVKSKLTDNRTSGR